MKLTAKEKRWLSAIQELLANPPSDRLGFYTIGDPTVTVYDRTKEDKINEFMDYGRMDFCGAVRKAKAETAHSLEFPAPVHSTSG